MSAVAGVTVTTVDGESAASTAWDKDESVTIGGSIDAGFEGGDIFAIAGGLFCGEGRPLVENVALGDGVWPPAKPPKEPKEPESLFEKLLRLLCAEFLLEAVDCDHLFRFPTASRKPFPLSGRVYKALDLRLVVSGDKVRPEKFVGMVFASLGLCDLRPATGGCVPLRALTEEARCTVMTEEDDAELGLEPCRCCVGGLANDAMSTGAVCRLWWDVLFGSALDAGQETRVEVPQRRQRVKWHASSSCSMTTEMPLSSE